MQAHKNSYRGASLLPTPPKQHTLNGHPQPKQVPGAFWIVQPDDLHAPDEERARCAYCGVPWDTHPKERPTSPPSPKQSRRIKLATLLKMFNDRPAPGQLRGLRRAWENPEWRERRREAMKQRWADKEYRARQRELSRARALAKWAAKSPEEKAAWKAQASQRAKDQFDAKYRPGYVRGINTTEAPQPQAVPA